MRRAGTPYDACKKKICEIWNVINDLRSRVSNAYTYLNGQQADGSNNLQISGSEGITVETRSGNEIRLIGVAAEPYTAEAPIVIDPDTRTVSLTMDAVPVSGSGNAVESGGVYAAVRSLEEDITQEAADRAAADTGLQTAINNLDGDLDAETAARTLADSAESSARIAADNALGDRIDKVIDGTTPPATISGVLPTSLGGTGSARVNNTISITLNNNIYVPGLVVAGTLITTIISDIPGYYASGINGNIYIRTYGTDVASGQITTSSMDHTNGISTLVEPAIFGLT